MRHLSAFLLFCCIISGRTFAQETPRAEVFIGYSYLDADTNKLTPRQNVNGAVISLTGNLNSWIGAEANLSGYYKKINLDGVSVSFRDYAFLFGPRLRYKWAFAHALVGIDDLGGSAFGVSATTSSIAGAFGGGASYKVARHINVEAAADYVLSRHNLFGGSAVTQNNYRAYGGIVFTFGSTGAAVQRTAQPQVEHVNRTGMKIDALGIIATIGTNQGAEISDLAPNGVAALSGLHPGDVINAVDGKPVKTPMELAAELANHAAGDRIKLGYMLHGEWQSETVVVLR